MWCDGKYFATAAGGSFHSPFLNSNCLGVCYVYEQKHAGPTCLSRGTRHSVRRNPPACRTARRAARVGPGWNPGPAPPPPPPSPCDTPAADCRGEDPSTTSPRCSWCFCLSCGRTQFTRRAQHYRRDSMGRPWGDGVAQLAERWIPDPVIHVRVRWIRERQKDPACTLII